MQCLRCGRETENEQVFCFACEALMAKHPVKPNTVITLPERSIRMRHIASRKPQKEEVENTDHLHRTIAQLRLWVCLLMAALILCVATLTWQELRQTSKPSIGQNYHSATEQTGTGQ